MRPSFFYNIGIYHSKFPISNDRSFEKFFQNLYSESSFKYPLCHTFRQLQKVRKTKYFNPRTISTFIYSHTHTHTHTHSLILSLSISLRVYTCVYVCVCVCVYVYMHAYVYKYGFIWNYIYEYREYIYIIILFYVMAYSKVPSHIH